MLDAPALCRAATGGDREALGRLLATYQAALWPLCWRGTGGVTADAEDVLQETFFRAIRGIAGYDPARPIEAWLRGIARHVIADHHRSRGPTPVGDALDVPDTSPLPPADDPGERLATLLARVDPTTRATLLLRYGEGCSWDEIARLLGTSRDAIKKRLHRGKAALRATHGDDR